MPRQKYEATVDYPMLKISIKSYVKKLPTARVTIFFTMVRVYGYNMCDSVSSVVIKVAWDKCVWQHGIDYFLVNTND